MMMDGFSWNLVRPWTDELIKDVKDNQWMYLPRPDWPSNGQAIWTNIGRCFFLNTISIFYDLEILG